MSQKSKQTNEQILSEKNLYFQNIITGFLSPGVTKTDCSSGDPKQDDVVAKLQFPPFYQRRGSSCELISERKLEVHLTL